jgi:hypothetical protein
MVNGKQTVHNEKLWTEFLAKANEEL